MSPKQDLIPIPPLLEEVYEGLEDARGSWPSLALEAGIDYSTLCKLAQGRIENPGIWTVWQVKRALDARLG